MTDAQPADIPKSPASSECTPIVGNLDGYTTPTLPENLPDARSPLSPESPQVSRSPVAPEISSDAKSPLSPESPHLTVSPVAQQVPDSNGLLDGIEEPMQVRRISMDFSDNDKQLVEGLGEMKSVGL